MVSDWKIKLLYGKIAACLLAIIALNSCATIIGKNRPESINIQSAPDQADIIIYDESGAKVFEGKTPTPVNLEKKRAYFSGKKYTVKISKAGFSEKTVTVNTRVNGWYIGGNIIFGGVFGAIGWLVVDPNTGAMWTLDARDINVALPEEKQEGSIIDPHASGIVLLQDVPVSLQNKMTNIEQ
jgi:hypothetical protein